MNEIKLLQKLAGLNEWKIIPVGPRVEKNRVWKFLEDNVSKDDTSTFERIEDILLSERELTPQMFDKIWKIYSEWYGMNDEEDYNGNTRLSVYHWVKTGTV